MYGSVIVQFSGELPLTLCRRLLFAAAAELDFPRRIATVTGSATVDACCAAVSTSGRFTATLLAPEVVALKVSGMSAASQTQISPALSAVAGVSSKSMCYPSLLNVRFFAFRKFVFQRVVYTGTRVSGRCDLSVTVSVTDHVLLVTAQVFK
jgi:hypothetical protein